MNYMGYEELEKIAELRDKGLLTAEEFEREKNKILNKKEKTDEEKKTGKKSKLAAGLLGIFLGCLGVHNFYLGYDGKGIAQLLITVLSCGILTPVSFIWGLIEGIMILTGEMNKDANGNILID